MVLTLLIYSRCVAGVTDFRDQGPGHRNDYGHGGQHVYFTNIIFFVSTNSPAVSR